MADPNLDVRPPTRSYAGLHIVLAVAMSLAGVLLMLTVALMQIGVVILAAGLVYAVLAIIMYRAGAGRSAGGRRSDSGT